MQRLISLINCSFAYEFHEKIKISQNGWVSADPDTMTKPTTLNDDDDDDDKLINYTMTGP